MIIFTVEEGRVFYRGLSVGGLVTDEVGIASFFEEGFEIVQGVLLCANGVKN